MLGAGFKKYSLQYSIIFFHKCFVLWVLNNENINISEKIIKKKISQKNL
jgi:hypothetical protein